MPRKHDQHQDQVTGMRPNTMGYQIQKLERMAIGNSCTIYRGYIGQTPVGVKHMVRRKRSYEFFQNEVESMKLAQDSKHTVRYIDSFRHEENMFIIMEWIDGITMNEYLKKKRLAGQTLSESRVREIAAGIVDVLRQCHRYRFIYGDLKLENIMVDRYGRTKIIDFGCMRPYGYGMPYYVGTPLYFSPEMIGNKVLLPAYDSWALGILIYLMATGGYHPFLPQSPTDMDELREGILHGKLLLTGPVWEAWSPAGRELVASLLHKDPLLRPTVHEIFNHPWF